MHSSLTRLVSFASARLDNGRAARLAVWLVPLALGLLSICLGQDDNWDLKNYHLYNPFAFLNGKIGFDLAPGQWQSYFNPTLDLLYYGLVTALPAPLAGFVMGVLHGLNFVLVVLIARQVLPRPVHDRGFIVPLLLAGAGILGTAFLAQLGNSMGDNMTALFVLGSVWWILRQWNQLAAGGKGAIVTALGAGLVMGCGSGLKLTNATYALALCLSLLALPGSLRARLGIAFVFGIGVLGGIGATGGHWYWLMQHTFGNPLFPQFNDHFLAPLAAPIGIGDTSWLPKTFTEKVLWPFIFALDPRRVGELPLRLWLWPVLYLAFLLAAFNLGATPRAGSMPSPMLRRQRLLLLFFALSYLGWLNIFGIYRYLVPLELFLPLVLWLLMARLLPAPWAGRAAAAVILAGTLVGIPHASWGHAAWARSAFSAEVPTIAKPEASMVFTVHGNPPMGWLATRFPATLAFVALGSGFPESPAYADRVRQMAAARTGPLYVMMQADRTAPGAQRSAGQFEEAQKANEATLAQGAEVLGRYGFGFDAASCKSYPAFVGKSRWNYQLCVVHAK